MSSKPFLSTDPAPPTVLDPIMGKVHTEAPSDTLPLGAVRRQKTVTTLLEAMPYVSKFWGSTIVVKYGGMTIDSAHLHEEFAHDMVILRLLGMHPIVVHDEAAGEEDLVHLIRKHEGMAVRVSGVKPKALGHLAEHAVPVVGSPGAVRMTLRGVGDGGTPVTLDSDTVAGAIAAALGAEKLVFLSDVDGVYEDQGGDVAPISECDLACLGALQASGRISGGMEGKVSAVRQALEAGVGSAHIIDGRVEHAILLEILTDNGCGTKVTL